MSQDRYANEPTSDKMSFYPLVLMRTLTLLDRACSTPHLPTYRFFHLLKPTSFFPGPFLSCLTAV